MWLHATLSDDDIEQLLRHLDNTHGMYAFFGSRLRCTPSRTAVRQSQQLQYTRNGMFLAVYQLRCVYVCVCVCVCASYFFWQQSQSR